jgi:UDP-glucose 4-epimerase
MASVLIVGGNGFLGSCLAKSLFSSFDRIDGLGRSCLKSSSFTHWHQADINSSSLILDLSEYDYIVHCAASASVSSVDKDPAKGFRDTFMSLQSLLQIYKASHSKAKIIFTSSAAVYGESDHLPLEVNCRLNPVSSYGRYKLMCEVLLEDYARVYNIPFAVIRFFSLYGPWLRKQLLWDASNKLVSLQSSSTTFFGSGNETRDWIYIDDAVSLIEFMFTCQLEFVNGASGRSTTISSVVNQLRTALGSCHSIFFNNSNRVGDPRHYHADISNLRALGWNPRVTLEEGIANYSEWFLNQERIQS